MAAGTASVSGGGSVPATNTATATAAPTATSSGSSGGSTGGGSGTTGGAGGGGSGNTWTGYSSVSPIATASVIGAAAQATPVLNVIKYVVPVAMMGAAVL